MKIEVLRAWPRRFARVQVGLPEGARVIDALRAAGLEGDPETAAVAVFGVAVDPVHALADGDRIEVLRPLRADPKDARRSRARLQRRT